LPRGATVKTCRMDIAKLARNQAVNRVAIGAGLVLAPGLLGRVWVGSWAADDRAKVLARSLGVRDLALGAAGILAVKERDRGWLQRAFAAQAAADAIDFLALVAGRGAPLPSRLLGGTLAATSAAVAAAYARNPDV
jgi:hypothetical protein